MKITRSSVLREAAIAEFPLVEFASTILLYYIGDKRKK